MMNINYLISEIIQLFRILINDGRNIRVKKGDKKERENFRYFLLTTGYLIVEIGFLFLY